MHSGEPPKGRCLEHQDTHPIARKFAGWSVELRYLRKENRKVCRGSSIWFYQCESPRFLSKAKVTQAAAKNRAPPCIRSCCLFVALCLFFEFSERLCVSVDCTFLWKSTKIPNIVITSWNINQHIFGACWSISNIPAFMIQRFLLDDRGLHTHKYDHFNVPEKQSLKEIQHEAMAEGNCSNGDKRWPMRRLSRMSFSA